jgi:hypothetical protein
LVKSNKRRTSGFRNLLWEFKFTKFAELEAKCSQIAQSDDVHRLHKEGFNNLCAGIDEFLTENKINFDNHEIGHFKIYSSVAVESTEIIRTAGKFYGNEWFSDVVVSSEETEWYGKVFVI